LALRKGLVKSIIPLPVPDIPSDVGREVTDEEIKRLYAVSRDELRFQIEIAVKMGLRLREMLSLRWDRIEWASRLVRLRPEDTKTRRGRIIPMNSDLFPQFESRFRIAKTPFVFPRVTDPTRPMHDNKKQWQAAKRRAGVKARWHDLRHSAATVAIRRGVPLATVSRLLGMSEGMLLKIYHHVNVDDLRRGADAMRDRK
jgi:integrase